MWPLEIVAAIIDATDVTTDVASIDAAVALGIPVEYISRLDAHNRDDQDPEGPWHQLADSPTLFLYDDGVRYSKTIRVMK